MFDQDEQVVTQRTGPCPTNCLTVDVEDYFHTEAMTSAVRRDQWAMQQPHVEENTKRLFELFAAHGARATFFFLGWVAEKFPRLVREAAGYGHEIGCHSYWHRLVYRLTPAQFWEDTKRAKEVIEEAAGVPVAGYRAPNFSIVKGTEWAPEILAELGFTYDSSVYPIRHDTYNNPGGQRRPGVIAGRNLMEFPIATLAIGRHNLPVGGGAYLRILPYQYMYWGLSYLARANEWPAICYIHPWEVDPEQPRLQVGTRSRFRQYTGLRTTAGKLERLLKDFRFVSIKEAFSKELATCSSDA